VANREVETFDDYGDVYVGFKFLADYHGRKLTDDGYRSALELADARGLSVLLHTWGGSGFNGHEEVRAVAGKYPGAKLIMGHSLHGDWDRAIAIARQFPNTYLELTAVLDEQGALEKFVDNLGSERILFGTDFPWFDFHYYIGAILGAQITDEDRRNIFYRNAQELLGDKTAK
jgi:predicted TIM-barrel fold metal-dependent hydrolase